MPALRDVDEEVLDSFGCVFEVCVWLVTVPVTALRGIFFFNFAGLETCALVVEPEDIEDSRTGSRPDRELAVFLVAWRERVVLDSTGLCVRARSRGPDVAVVAGEYDDAELGVGTWLKGDSV